MLAHKNYFVPPPIDKKQYGVCSCIRSRMIDLSAVLSSDYLFKTIFLYLYNILYNNQYSYMLEYILYILSIHLQYVPQGMPTILVMSQ